MSVAQLIISEDKITRYLLDINHPVGGPKARFFMNRGFTPAAPNVLADALAAHASSKWPGAPIVTPYGPKHRIIGPMLCPDGTRPTILAIWLVQTGRSLADFVTAYPRLPGSASGIGTN